MTEEYILRSLKFNGLDCFVEYLKDNKNLSEADMQRLVVNDVVPHLKKRENVPPLVGNMQKMFGNLLKRPFPTVTFKGDQPSIPAFDHFVNIKPEIRMDLFFMANRMYDIYIGRVVGHQDTFAVLNAICFWDKEILIEDLEYKVYLDDPGKSYAVNTLLRVRLMKANLFERRLLVTANSKDYKGDVGAPELGVITEDDFPEHFKLRKRTEKDLATFVKKKSSLVHDGHMTFLNRLPTFTNMKAVYKPEDLVSYQLKQQASELSKKHFKEGQELIITEPKKALELMEESLKLNPENAHALLYKGLILSNLGKFQMAIETYKKAEEIGSENVDQYIVTCLERQVEAENDPEEKFHLYSKLIKLNKKHKEAITYMTQFLVIKFSEEQSTIYENLSQDLEMPFHNLHLDEGSDMEIAESGSNKIEVVKQEPKDTSQAALYFFNKALEDTLPAEPDVEILPPEPKPPKWFPLVELDDDEEETPTHSHTNKNERSKVKDSDKRKESSDKYRSVSPLSDSSSKSSRKKHRRRKHSSSHRHDRRKHRRRRHHRSPSSSPSGSPRCRRSHSASPRRRRSHSYSPRRFSRGDNSLKSRSHNSPFEDGELSTSS